MFKFIKQLFCNHIWDSDSEKYLRAERLEDGGIGMFYLPTFSDFKIYATCQHCLKCENKRIIEVYKNIGNKSI